jgi:hypothetical protein
MTPEKTPAADPSMRLAFFIGAHRRPDLLRRLVDTLDGRPVSIHIDKRSPIFAEAQAALGTRVTFVPRHRCRWGLFGIVEATLEGLRWFLGTDATHLAVITGQCYPLVPVAAMEQDLADIGGKSLLEHEAFPRQAWAGERGGYRRIESFFFKGPGVIPRSIMPWRRRAPAGLHPYGGGSYCCLSRACVEYAITYLDSHPEVMRFFRTTLIPDELLLQTVLANSPLKDQLVDSLIHYTVWLPHAANPKLLQAEDIPAALDSGMWFARKFDDLPVLDEIDGLRPGRTAHRPTEPQGLRAK